MSFYPFQFKAPVTRQHMGKELYYTVVVLPVDLEPHLPFDRFPRLRVEGEVDGVPIEGTFMLGGGYFYLMTPRKLLKKLGKEVGDEVKVDFGVADQDAVHMPPELAEALDDAPDLAEIWNSWTPGKRPGHAHRVTSAKAAATKAKRVAEILDLLAG